MVEVIEYECEAGHTCNHRGGLSLGGGLLCECRTPEKCPYARKVETEVNSRQADCSMKY